jgi:cell division transport system ATP-binding protein
LLPVIKLASVSKRFPRSRFALRDISFHIRKGEFAFLMGHSGAGKSSILRLLLLEQWPDGGEVEVCGNSSARIRPRDVPFIRRKIGIVFQDFRLLEQRTVEENVAFVLEVTGVRPKSIRPRVAKLLQQVGLAAKAQAYPNELSGGEKQRVAIARALANEPLILLADEPTGNLDETATGSIFRLFQEINASGMTVVMATHDMELVRTRPEYQRLELEEGRLVFDSAAALTAPDATLLEQV